MPSSNRGAVCGAGALLARALGFEPAERAAFLAGAWRVPSWEEIAAAETAQRVR